MKTLLIISSFLLFSFTQHNKQLHAIELRGVVVNAETGLPVSNVYVYSVRGEEETLTDKKGAFKIISWQQLPVSITCTHKEYEETKLRVSETANAIIIKLKKK